jgi:hypothetical protein
MSHGFLCAQEHDFLVLVISSWVSWASLMSRISHKMSSHGCRHLQNYTRLAWSPSKRFVLFGGDMDGKPSWCSEHNRSEMVAVLGPYEALPYYIHIYIHHGAKFTIAIYLLYQLSWKFCEYLYICTWASLQCCQIVIISHHHTCSAFTCVKEPVSFKVLSMFSNVLWWMWNSVKWISLQVFHHSSRGISITETVYEINVYVLSILTVIALQHNTATLA